MNSMLLQFIMGIGLLQSVILGCILLIYPGANKQVSKLVGLSLLFAGFLIASELAEQFNLKNSLGIIMELSILIDLILMVLMWMISRFISGTKKKFLTRDLLQLWPIFVGAALFIILVHTLPLEIPGTFSNIPDAIGLFLGYKNAVWLSYAILIFKSYFSKKHPQPQGSYHLKKKMFRNILWPYLVVCFISYSAFWMMFFGLQFPLNLDADYLAILLVVGFVYYLTFTILKEPQMLITINTGRPLPKYGNSKMEKTRSEAYKKRLLAFLDTEKPYLDNKLSILQLAHNLDLPVNTVSQLINEQFGKNFHDFINAYRLKEVKLKLLDASEDHKTLLALAFEAGFQSKASFNRVFKKSEGMTPTEFKSRYRSQPTF